jgi:hypothetical protein
MQLLVKTVSGETLVATQLDTDALVRNLRQEVEGRDPACTGACMVFAGVNMEDDQPLASYNLQDDSTIHMVARLPGGSDADFSCAPGIPCTIL